MKKSSSTPQKENRDRNVNIIPPATISKTPDKIQKEILLSPRGSANPVTAVVDFLSVPDKKDKNKSKYIMAKCIREVPMNIGLGVRDRGDCYKKFWKH
jgi:hypothetical protein